MEELLHNAASLSLLVLHVAAVYLVWRGLRSILKPDGAAMPAAEEIVLSRETEEALSGVDWSRREVLVGSVRTPEQLCFNLEARAYYVPARYLSGTPGPLRYVALHQEGPGQEPGIRLFAEILNVRQVPRGTIPVTMRSRTNPEEPYCFFDLGPWQQLPRPIVLQDTPRGKPRFTNRFLLEHCGSSYQLFAVSSEEGYRLLAAVCAAFDRASTLPPRKAAAYRAGDSHRLLAEPGWVTVQDAAGRTLDRIPLSAYSKSPRAVFLRVRRLILDPPGGRL